MFTNNYISVREGGGEDKPVDWNGAPLEDLLPEIIYSEIGKEMSWLYVGPDVFCSFEPRVSSSSPGDSSLD
jgi:hypothetical protein